MFIFKKIHGEGGTEWEVGGMLGPIETVDQERCARKEKTVLRTTE
jgi:hypothetical protein